LEEQNLLLEMERKRREEEDLKLERAFEQATLAESATKNEPMTPP